MTRQEKILSEISSGVHKHGIKCEMDWIQKTGSTEFLDGQFLDNVVFVKNGIEKRIYRPLLLRLGGQSHHFVHNGNDFDLVPLTDKEWVKNWIDKIKIYFNEND